MNIYKWEYINKDLEAVYGYKTHIAGFGVRFL